MAIIKINGTLDPVRQPIEVTFDPQRGMAVRYRWESGGDNLRALAQELLNLRVGFELTRSPAKSQLAATASGPETGQPETTTDTWQILANEIQKDIRGHPTFLAMEKNFPGTIGYVMRDVDLYNQGKPPGDPAPNSGALPQSGWLFSLLVRGQSHYATGQYVLRHSTNVSNVYAVNVADINVESVYTTDQLIAEATDANAWTFPLPGRLKYKLQNLPAPPEVVNYLWGWRKLPSTETTNAHYRVDITTEYWLEQWPLFVYPAAT